MKKIKVHYSPEYYIDDDKVFSIMVPQTATFEEFLELVRKQQRDSSFKYVFYDISQISNDDSVIDYWESDPDIVFLVKRNEYTPKSYEQQKFENLQKATTTKLTTFNFYQDTYLTIQLFTGKDIKTFDILLEHTYFNMYYAKCSEMLDHEVSLKLSDRKSMFLYYFPGGFPFISGSLESIFVDFQAKNKKIFVILSRPVSPNALNSFIPEVCNISSESQKLLLSPLCESTKLGLSRIACLLGYLSHGGSQSDLLLRVFAYVTNFPPLITSMAKIIANNGIKGIDVVTFCSSLFTFFKYCLQSSCPDDQVFEHTFQLCNYFIDTIKDPPEKLPIVEIDVDNKSKENEIFSELNLGPSFYLWRDKLAEKFEKVDFEMPSSNDLNKEGVFTPIHPLLLRTATCCSIVKGKDHEYLFLTQSLLKKNENQNKVCVLNPKSGMTEIVEIDSFAKSQQSKVLDNDMSDEISQIIMFNLCHSKTMLNSFDGSVQRITVAYQYLTTILSKIYGYRIQSIQGLVSFNSEATVKCPLSLFIDDIETKGFDNFTPESGFEVWNSIKLSCNEIIRFRKDKNGKEIFRRAISRILIITDNCDEISDEEIALLLKILIENKIVVDSIILTNANKRAFGLLCAVSHATGGLSIQPKSVEEGLKLIESSAFININERKKSFKSLVSYDYSLTPFNLKSSQISKNLIEKAIQNFEFDRKIQNKELFQSALSNRLATPRNVISAKQDSLLLKSRSKRILSELRECIGLSNPDSVNYDPDLKIFTERSNAEKWRVYMKGPEGTPYEQKWWYLVVTFPEEYPSKPPNCRFISIPFHYNITPDGIICHNIFTCEYLPSNHVCDILHEIQQMLIIPNREISANAFAALLDDEIYLKKAIESTDKYAKDDYKDFIGSSLVIDDVHDDFDEDCCSIHMPEYMISQISGKQIKQKNLVLSSTGVKYDKYELLQLISSNKKPKCVITGKKLKEKPEDLI